MTMATVTSKGQITIPASVRSDLRVESGDRVEFVKIDEGRYELVAATRDITCLRGLVKMDRVATLEDMEESIARGATE